MRIVVGTKRTFPPGSTPTAMDNFELGTADAVGGVTDASAMDAGTRKSAIRSAVTRSSKFFIQGPSRLSSET
jgi:hypothetical protein